MRIRRHTVRGLVTSLSVLSLMTVGLAGCGGSLEFQGQNPLVVAGDPPALPPPAPPPAPPPPPEPPKPPPRVEVTDNAIVIHEKIQFEYNKATIKEVSFGLLDEIGDVIKKNAQIKKIRIEGHASSEGNTAHNKTLSDDRAKAVMKYLVGHGISQDMLIAKGYGSEKPIADNATDDGKEKNRRVEFNIIEQDVTKKKIEVDSTGQQKVLEEQKETRKAADADADEGTKPAAAKDKGAKDKAAKPEAAKDKTLKPEAAKDKATKPEADKAAKDKAAKPAPKP
jgi:outer membrane protein OmpA-like peptidoglycan-associated protein